MSTPPEQPDDASPDRAQSSIARQIDELLIEVEPGTGDAEALTGSFQTVEQSVANHAETRTTQAEIDALPNESPSAAPPAPATTPPAPSTGDAASMEDKLQQEIAALMDAEPAAAASVTTQGSAEGADDFDALGGSFASPESLGVATQAAEATDPPNSTTQDLIAQEIEGLLDTGQGQAEAPAPPAADHTIDELDKMLAQEIDEDDELAGDFQSVEDLTAGIQVPDPGQVALDDDHAATARDVAAELDSQPEDLPVGPAGASMGEEVDDPFAVLAEIADNAEQNEKEHQQQVAMDRPNWERWLEVGKARLLNACFLINWPARQFLTAEWRANLGYIALLNLFFGVGLWIVMILF